MKAELESLSVGERHARREQPLSRQKLRDAIDRIANRYGACGTEIGNALCDAFRALSKELE